jgi:tetratricopeptide (TPR) repeat protein
MKQLIKGGKGDPKMSTVQTSKTTITLPTYPMGAPNLNPIISPYRSEKPYPYPMRDALSDEKQDVEYEALTIENEYLRLTVIPALGGKLYSALDKRNGQELFYRNHVVKPQLVGLTGAWTSGGIEFNFPFGHRPSTMEVIETAVRQHPDGSGSIHVGEVDKISGVRFHVELKLEPGKAYIEQIVSIHNPTPLPQRFFYWNTASYPETEDLQCRYPAQWIIEEYSRKRKPWPYDGDVDVRWSRNIRKFSSIFTSFTDEDFFGVYDMQRGVGNIHVADHREVPGKKFWSWGQSELGKRWNQVLTDEDGPYMEHQAGNIETQAEYRYLAPYQRSTWKEYWFQAIDTGPFTYADRHAVFTTAFEKTGPDRLKLNLAVRGNMRIDGATVQIVHDGQVVHALNLHLDPERTLRQPLDLELRHLTEGWLKLRVLDASGELLAEHTIRRCDDPVEQVEEPADIYPDEDLTARLVEIAKAEERLLYDRTVQLYDDLLASHPHYVEAYIRKAVVQLKMLRVDDASVTIEKALSLTPYSEEAHYYTGLIGYIKGQWTRAKQHLLQIIDTSPLAAQSNILLGKIALRKGDAYRALQYFRLAQKRADHADTAEVLEAYALRKLGQAVQAREKLTAVLNIDPLNGPALAELDAIDGGNGRAIVVRDDIHNALNLVQFYHELGDAEACRMVLHGFPNGGEHPLVLYHLGYLAALQGDAGQARNHYLLAEMKRPDLVFPMHGVTLEALQDAAERLADKAVHTLYYLGLILNARERFAEAIDAWHRALDRGMEYSVLCRNLGHYYMQRGEDDQAIAILERGLRMQPVNSDIAVYLNSLYKRKGWTEKREALLGELRLDQLDQMSARMKIGILNDTGRYEEALDILTHFRFRNWEIEYVSDLNLRTLYRDARLGRAKQLMREQRWDDAIRELEASLSYPDNLLLGKRWDQSFAKEHYMLAVCHEKRGDFGKAIAYCAKVIEEGIQPGDEAYPDYVKAVHLRAELEWLGFTEGSME